MEINEISQYIKEQIRIHIGICYKEDALECFDQAIIGFCTF